MTTAALLLFAGAAAAVAECVTDARRISTRSAVPNLIAGPSAWSGFGLGVAKTQDGDPDSIWFAVYDEMLQPLVGDKRVVTDAGDKDALIDLVWNGLEYGLFYRAETRLHLQRLSSSGELLGGPIVIDPARVATIRQPIKVEWSDALNAWVVARVITSGTRRDLWTIVVERNGAVRHEQSLATAPDSNPYLQLAVTDSGVIGVFNVSGGDDSLHYTRYVPGQSQFPPTKTIAPSGVRTQVLAIGERFVIARSVEDDIRWMIIDTNGAVVKNDALLVEAEDGEAVLPYALAEGDGELALTYSHTSTTNEPDFRLRRFTLDGTVISDTLFAASETRARYAFTPYPAVWNGTSWLIAAARNSATNGDSWIERYCPLAVQILANPIAKLGQPATFRAFVSGGAPGYQFEWSFTRDPGGNKRTEVVERTYGQPGNAVATLKVTDSSGETETHQFAFTVVPDQPEPDPVKGRRRAVRK
ncbi:MAG: PKD domain-containing protein [Thermoanaerobaculia bacterium]